MRRNKPILFCIRRGENVDENLQLTGQTVYLCSRQPRGRLANGLAVGQWGRGGIAVRQSVS